ncbi:hypothetical protein XENORESO_005544 [Xenotaenia resolanae]|uniref:Uncharacterized protein n=1 Tax=Xenotaenia resolanae TaxID=208358 RepID=A0ABV0WLG0_9TELE
MKIKEVCVLFSGEQKGREVEIQRGRESHSESVQESDFGLVATSLFHFERNRSRENRSPESSSAVFKPGGTTLLFGQPQLLSSSSSSSLSHCDLAKPFPRHICSCVVRRDRDGDAVASGLDFSATSLYLSPSLSVCLSVRLSVCLCVSSRKGGQGGLNVMSCHQKQKEKRKREGERGGIGGEETQRDAEMDKREKL